MTSCCYCGRGLSNPTSIGRGCGPICYRKHGACAGGGGDGGQFVQTFVGRAVVKVGPDLLRGAAVGFACGAVPTACPAILAVNQSATVAKAILKVYNAFAQAKTPETRVQDTATEAARQVASMALSELVQHGSGEQISAVSQTVGKALGSSVGAVFGTGKETVEVLATETTRHALEGGTDGFLSWGVEGPVR